VASERFEAAPNLLARPVTVLFRPASPAPLL